MRSFVALTRREVLFQMPACGLETSENGVHAYSLEASGYSHLPALCADDKMFVRGARQLLNHQLNSQD